jgi:hypothetical protein
MFELLIFSMTRMPTSVVASAACGRLPSCVLLEEAQATAPIERADRDDGGEDD